MNPSSPSDPQLLLLHNRYSGRAYDPRKPITTSEIKRLQDAAHLAPSCYNEQPWRFIFCDKAGHEEGYKKIWDSLVEFNQNWTQHAPLLIVAAYSRNFAKNGKPNAWAPYDTGAASLSLALEAASLGLMAHQMGGFDPEKLIKSFQIPVDFTPIAVIAVGHQAKEEGVIPKERKPLGETMFEGKWGT